MTREPCPNPKIVKNLCTFACSDPSATPSVNLNMTLSTDEAPASPVSVGAPSSPLASQGGPGPLVNDREHTVHCDQYNGILTLVQQHKVWEYFGRMLTLQVPHYQIRPKILILGQGNVIFFSSWWKVRKCYLQTFSVPIRVLSSKKLAMTFAKHSRVMLLVWCR